MIQPPRLDAPLDVSGKLSAESQILGADRASRTQEQHGDLDQISKDFDDSPRQGHHAGIMPVLSNTFVQYAFDLWMTRTHPYLPWRSVCR